jgi:alpha/beta superfamily hydrolase
MSLVREHAFELAGPAGRLEALLSLPAAPAAGGALLLHPHPLYGGNLHNKVVFTSQQVCARLGLATLRFNFRGVGASAGAYDDGQGEQADARAALAALAAALPEQPLSVVGFSFGAWIALRLAADEPRVATVAALGTPVDWAALDFLARCAKPKLFIHGSEDQYCDPEALARRYPDYAPPKRLEWIAGADHFFTGQLPALSRALQAHFPLPGAEWLRSPPA